MIKINVVCVGKVKENYFADGIAEYAKRLQKFCKFEITEVQEENYTKFSPSLVPSILEKEAERIIPHLSGYVICSVIEGKKFSSEKFAERLKKAADTSGKITFVIGGSYGVSESVKKLADELVSFSDMTFPHTLFRVMLSEQIYRAFTIISGSAYHK